MKNHEIVLRCLCFMSGLKKCLLGTAAVLAVVLAANMTTISTAINYLQGGRMAYGLTVGGRAIGGMTREEAAEEVLRGAGKSLAGDVLVLSLPGEEKTFAFPAKEIGLLADVNAMLDAAYQIGRNGAPFQDFFDAANCAINGKEVLAEVRLDETKLTETLNRVKQEVDREPVDASIAFSAAGIEHHAGMTGRKMDVKATAEAVKPELLTLRLPCRETISLEETKPKIGLEDVKAIDGLLGSCSTYYIADTGRGDNIEIATAALNHCLIKPGEELSFNTRVGRRVASAGYATAPVIVNGKVEQDIGGGVCQVSSTLYNAILLAGLTPTARTSHFYPSAYIDAGLDATVADGQIDFVFQNTLPHSVILRAGASAGTLTVEVYGHRADLPGEYDLETAIIGPPPTVEVYRVLYQGDTVVNREYLYTDIYDVPPPPEDEKKPAPSATEPDATPTTEPEPTKPTKPTVPETPAPKPETKPEAKPETKPEAKPTKPTERQPEKNKKPSP